ncbi:MAG: hypothetical protein CMA12_00890 [Euryarchaeota archaeon]|nr:hypothetical protein [Euryarchaeota archaeon]
MSKNKKIIPIDYTHREYRSIKQDLLGIVERYYPDQFQDFSEASFGSMMLDAVAYVGDQMSFYLDYNVNESFLDTSYSLQNIQRHGRILGYKEKGPASTFGTIAMFLEVPAEASGLGPDVKYIPTLNRGTRFKSQSGLSYLLTENINFSDPKHPIVVSKVGATTGAPTHYAIKAYGSIVSGVFGVEEITVGQYQKFRTLILQTTNVAEILSVIDSDGNKYYEVDNLSQDMVFQEIPNNNFKNDNVPSILKPLLVSRKFVVLRRGSSVSIQFGSGQESSTSLIADPQRVAMDVFGKDYVTSTTFDPTRISKNVNYGIVPSNTKLRILYRKTNPTNSNAAVGTINKVGNSSFDFGNLNGAANSKLVAVRESLEVTNESPIIGQNTYTSPQEIKQQIFDTFPTQNRAVTQADYENVLYRMPSKYGSIKRCSAQKDSDSLKRNLNMYVLSEDSFGKLVKTNLTIKQNIKTWLNHYRMMNDTIDLLDAHIINLGIEFIITVLPQAEKGTALAKANGQLSRYFSEGFYIGEHFQISDIYSELKKIPEVLDVTHVKIINKSGAQYSNIQFSVDKNLSPSGASLICPQNAIFEIKFPAVDIKGKFR